MTTYGKILAAMEARYDHQSARIVLSEALQKAGLNEKKQFEPKEVKALTKALSEVGQRMETVLEALEDAGTAKPAAPAPKAAAKAPAKKAPAGKKK